MEYWFRMGILLICVPLYLGLVYVLGVLTVRLAMFKVRTVRDSNAECVPALLGSASWIALTLAALNLAFMLFWPPTPTKSLGGDTTGDFHLNMLVVIGVLLSISAGARCAQPAGTRRFEREGYWISFGLVAVLWLTTLAQRLSL
jgi:hypothetical protein